MAVDLESVPTTNTLDLRTTFLLNNGSRASLNPGQAETFSLRFDAIGVGSSQRVTLLSRREISLSWIAVSTGKSPSATVHRGVSSRISSSSLITDN